MASTSTLLKISLLSGLTEALGLPAPVETAPPQGWLQDSNDPSQITTTPAMVPEMPLTISLPMTDVVLLTDLPILSIPPLSGITIQPDISATLGCAPSCSIYPTAQCYATWTKWLDTVLVGQAYLTLDKQGRYVDLSTLLYVDSMALVSSMHATLSYDAGPLQTMSKLDEPREAYVYCKWNDDPTVTFPIDRAPTQLDLGFRATATAPVGESASCYQDLSCSGLVVCDSSFPLAQPTPMPVSDPYDYYGDAYTIDFYYSCPSAASVQQLAPSNTLLSSLLQSCTYSQCNEWMTRSIIRPSVAALISTMTVWLDFETTPIPRRSSITPYPILPPPAPTFTTLPAPTFIAGDRDSGAPAPTEMPSLANGYGDPVPFSTSSQFTIAFSNGQRGSAWFNTESPPMSTGASLYGWASLANPFDNPDRCASGTYQLTKPPTYYCEPLSTAYSGTDAVSTRRWHNTTFVIKNIISETIVPASWTSRALLQPSFSGGNRVPPILTSDEMSDTARFPVATLVPPACGCNGQRVDCQSFFSYGCSDPLQSTALPTFSPQGYPPPVSQLTTLETSTFSSEEQLHTALPPWCGCGRSAVPCASYFAFGCDKLATVSFEVPTSSSTAIESVGSTDIALSAEGTPKCFRGPCDGYAAPSDVDNGLK